MLVNVLGSVDFENLPLKRTAQRNPLRIGGKLANRDVVSLPFEDSPDSRGSLKKGDLGGFFLQNFSRPLFDKGRCFVKNCRTQVKLLFLIPLFLLFIVEAVAEPRPQFLSETKPARWSVDFVPLPYFDTDPNEGQTYGIQPNLFIKDPQGDLRVIVSPSITYNRNTQIGGGLSVTGYPSSDEEMGFSIGWAKKSYREVELYYRNQRAWKDRLFLEMNLHYLRDPFGRFYGLGNDAPSAQETTYTRHSLGFSAEVGLYLTRNFRLNFREQLMNFKVQPGILNKLPNTLDRFGSSQGVEDSFEAIQRFSAVYDSRPDGNFSNRGFYTEAYFFFSHPSLLSDHQFYGFGLDVRKTFSFRKERFTTALGGFFQKVSGDDVPFYHQSSLGGGYQLRGFGKDRFVDLGKFLFSVEERIRLKKFHLFDTDIHLTLAPFFEVGQVFHDFSSISFKKLQPVGGLGFRIFIPPNTVGRVDVGFGREGPSFFVKLDYPF